ncbi:unnamed protein product, partial [Ectocarpus sp. 4 AP-2014]
RRQPNFTRQLLVCCRLHHQNHSDPYRVTQLPESVMVSSSGAKPPTSGIASGPAGTSCTAVLCTNAFWSTKWDAYTWFRKYIQAWGERRVPNGSRSQDPLLECRVDS